MQGQGATAKRPKDILLIVVVLVALFVFFSKTKPGPDYQLGDQVVVITDASLLVNDQRVESVEPGNVVKVAGVNETQLWVAHRRAGWVNRTAVIPFDRAAIARLSDMIARNPRRSALYTGRASVRLRFGELDAALADATEALRLYPCAACYNDRGIVWRAKGDLDRAIADYDEALSRERHPTTFENRGLCWESKGSLDKAFADYSEAIQLDARCQSAHYHRALLRHRQREYDLAIADFDGALKADPRFSLAYQGRGVSWYSKGEWDKSIADTREASKLDPQNPQCYINLGDAWRKKREYENAIADYSRALQLAPKNLFALRGRAFAWREQGNYEQVIADSSEALSHDPKHTATLIQRGSARLMTGDRAQGLADFTEALRLKPGHARAAYYVALTQLIMGRPEAVESFRRAFELAPEEGSLSPWSVILGALAARRAGDMPRAEEFLADAVELSDDWPFPVVDFLLGELTEDDLMKLALDDEELADAHCFLGIHKSLQGNKGAARTHFVWVKQNGVKGRDAYLISVAELERLDR